MVLYVCEMMEVQPVEPPMLSVTDSAGTLVPLADSAPTTSRFPAVGLIVIAAEIPATWMPLRTCTTDKLLLESRANGSNAGIYSMFVAVV